MNILPDINGAQPLNLSTYKNAIQNMLDKKARDYGFDNMISASSYASVPNAYQSIATQLLTWRANVWVDAEAKMNAFNPEIEALPEIYELLASLPQFVEA